jgi:hypothetical protein
LAINLVFIISINIIHNLINEGGDNLAFNTHS